MIRQPLGTHIIPTLRGPVCCQDGRLDEYSVNENLINISPYEQRCRIEESDVWLDVGGHVGSFTLSIADRVLGVVTYEPDQRNFHVLSYNVALWGLTNVRLVNKAIAAEDAIREFYVREDGDTSHYSLRSTDCRVMTRVDADGIQRVLNEVRPTRVKIDVEGGEQEILDAVENWYDVQQVVVEWHFYLESDRDELGYAIDRLKLQGFDVTCDEVVPNMSRCFFVAEKKRR